MSEVKLWLPKGLDLQPRMVAAGMSGQTAYAEWLVSEVIRWGTLYKVPPRQFVPLAFTHLETVIPRNLVGRVKHALVPDVLETDDRYWFGPGWPGKCLGYRLAPAVTATPVVVPRFSVTLGRKLATADDRRAVEEERNEATHTPLLRRLREHVRSAWLTDQAKDDPHPVVEFLTGERPGWFVVCPQGRVHHPVASCPRRLRRHLRLADPNAPLSLVDVTTSQPLLLGLVVGGYTAQAPGAEATWPCAGETPSREKTAARPQPAVEHRRAAHLFSPDSDTRRFIDECLSGDLYTKLADAMSDLSAWCEYTREHAKTRWMRAVYGDPRLMDKQLAGRALAALYPQFFHRVRALAESGGRGHLARSMQRLESDVVIGGVAAALIDQHPAVPFVTIHDAVLCHTTHAPLVRQVFGEVFEHRFGVVPRLKVGPLSG